MAINPETLKSTPPAGAAYLGAEAFGEGCLPGHLVALPGAGSWAMWRWVGLRGTGFPMRLVSRLSSAKCAAAASKLIEAEEAAERARYEAIGSLKRELAETADVAVRRLLSKIIEHLKKGRRPGPASESFTPATDLSACREADAELERARADYADQYRAATLETSEAIHAVARSPRFQEAVTWQNRGAVRRGITSLLKREPGTSDSKQRRNEEMVASYVQRYCTKNDTIGFFGPVGWARFADQDAAVTLEPGESLLAQRGVYFEHWCIDTLAETIAADPAMRPHLKPRRVPYVRLEGRTLHQPLEEPCELSPVEYALLTGCEGRRTARQLVAALLARGDGRALQSEGQLYEVLEQLRARRLIVWTLDLPVQIRPDEALRDFLCGVDDEGLRREKLAALDELEQARRRVAAAAGDAAALDEALAGTEETFTRLTGAAATRSAGRTYAGRTLVYEDCRRHIDAALGAELRRRLSGPLALLLKSARWMIVEVAARYRRAFSDIYAQMREQRGTSAVPAVDFWLRAQRLIYGERTCLAAAVVPELQRRWQEVLGERAAGDGAVRFESAELEEKVGRAFGASGRGWHSARYHSPDVMVVARSAEAIRRGDYELVMGEVHIGVNTLGAGSFVEQHPRAGELYEAIASDIPEPRVIPSYSKNWPGANARTNLALLLPKDFSFEASDSAPTLAELGSLRIGELFVEEQGGRLCVRSADGRLSFDIIDFFGEAISPVVSSRFQPWEPRPHQPRVKIDDMVVRRESWSFAAQDLCWADEREEAERFLAARRWQRENRMPRTVFAKVPSEVKPFYVDFESPVYVTLFAKAVQRSVERGAGERPVKVSEMLPGLEEAWLEDAGGERYTCELRIVAVDQN